MGIYAIINVSTGEVLNTTVWDGVSEWSPGDGYIAVETNEASAGWTYVDGVFYPPQPVIVTPDNTELAYTARSAREQLLRTVYDPGILMSQRALRMAQTDTDRAYASSKIAELDVYAEALIAIPDQPGFPQTITWPVAPTK